MNEYSKGGASLKYLNKLEEIIISIGLLFTTVLVFLNVVLRLFGSGISWSEELIRYGLILVTFIGASVCVREGSHFSVDFILQLIKGRVKDALMVIIYLIALVFSVLLAYYALEFCKFSQSTNQMSPSLDIPMYVIYLIIPISGVLMFIRYVQCIIAIFINKNNEFDNSPVKGDLL